MFIDISKKDLRSGTKPQSGVRLLLSGKPCRQKRRMFSRRIAEDLSISKSTVFRAFNELEKHDLLERFPRYHPQGGRRSSLYRIKGEITKTNQPEKRGDKLV